MFFKTNGLLDFKGKERETERKKEIMVYKYSLINKTKKFNNGFAFNILWSYK